MIIDPKTFDRFSAVLTGVIVPRPIAFVSTISPDGVVNLAPYSFFNAVSYSTVVFSSSRNVGNKSKDTLRNIEETGEFVVNMATWELREKIATTSRFVEPEADEFEVAGLTKVPSRYVAPPRVAESPIHLECRYHSTMTLPSNQRSTAHHVVLGNVVGIHIRDDVLTVDGKIDVLKIRPLARLGYLDYTSVTISVLIFLSSIFANSSLALPHKDLPIKALAPLPTKFLISSVVLVLYPYFFIT